ncbi:MAG TPA: PilZ domain-containing protein [Myxococcota bacterium]
MSNAPSVLVLDDGELERLQQVLERLGSDFVRLTAEGIPKEVEAPRDLLITSGRRAMSMPRVVTRAQIAPKPFWVCIYDQDFRPLRERLRSLGVHFLIRGEVDAASVRLFLLQLLHRGAERRRCRRIPLHCEMELEIGADRRKVRLVEISGETCRFITDRDIPGGARVTLRLPTSLTGGESYDLKGRRIRAAACESPVGESALAIVVGFRDLEPDARAQIEALLAGSQKGTQVTPLADEPEPEIAEEAAAPEPTLAPPQSAPEPWDPARDGERRGHARCVYDRRVEALRWSTDEGPRVALGKDLSLSGVRVVTSSRPHVGARVTLALYGGPREEPIVVEAEVVRVSGAESSLRFITLGRNERAQLEKMAGQRPNFESLQAEHEEGLVVARMLPGESVAEH